MLEQVKKLLDFSGNDKDELLNTIIDIVKARLCILLGTEEVPEKLSHIVVEVTIARFNRIGSEGTISHIVEGEHLEWGANANDFKPYMAEIEAYNASQSTPVKGRVRFI